MVVLPVWSNMNIKLKELNLKIGVEKHIGYGIMLAKFLKCMVKNVFIL